MIFLRWLVTREEDWASEGLRYQYLVDQKYRPLEQAARKKGKP
jgi:hypothetical protein